MMWLELLPCGCCAIAWMLLNLADGAASLTSILMPLDDPELADVLADEDPAREDALRDAFLADDAERRDRAAAAWYGPPAA